MVPEGEAYGNPGVEASTIHPCIGLKDELPDIKNHRSRSPKRFIENDYA